MKAPILINENGDLTVFSSVEAACQYLEPIDVDSGVYEAFDAAGKKLHLGVASDSSISSVNRPLEIVKVTISESGEYRAKQLKKIVKKYLDAIGSPVVDKNLSLSEIVGFLTVKIADDIDP